MPIPGRLLTTAMAVMPHTDAARALEDALSLDIPFWPQLPRLSYREDMYVQAAEHFPGIVLDLERLLAQSLISPATCCLVNPDGTGTVEKAFSVVRTLSTRLKDIYGIE